MNLFMNSSSLRIEQSSWTRSELCCSWTFIWVHELIISCSLEIFNMRETYGQKLSKQPFKMTLVGKWECWYTFTYVRWPRSTNLKSKSISRSSPCMSTFARDCVMNKSSWIIHEQFVNLFMNSCSLRFGQVHCLVHELKVHELFIHVHVHQGILVNSWAWLKSFVKLFDIDFYFAETTIRNQSYDAC